MRSLVRWIGFLIWAASATVVALAVKGAWPETTSRRVYVVLLGDSQGVEPTTEVAFQGVVIGNVTSVRMYAQLAPALAQSVRAWILALPRAEGKACSPDRAIVAEATVNVTLMRLDQPLFADVSHSKFTGRALVDVFVKKDAPVPSESKGPFLLGPFAEPSNMVENIETTLTSVLALSEKTDGWWKGNGPASLDAMGAGVARTADRLKKMEGTLAPADGGEGPIDRLDRSVRAFADRLPSGAPKGDRGDFMPGLAKLREKTLPDLTNGLAEIKTKVEGNWSALVEDAWGAARSMRSAFDRVAETMGKATAGLRAQLDKLEEAERSGMLKDLLEGGGK